MAPAKQTGNFTTGWSKWQIALAVGAPVAIGLGYWYLTRKPSEEKGPRKVDTKKKPSSQDNNSVQTSTDSPPEIKVEFPKAMKPEPETPKNPSQDHKNRGNEHFRNSRYEEAIDCYNNAIESCPPTDLNDLSTFYQNRAAAYEQLKQYQKARDDCTKALELNARYTKALLRRAKVCEHLDDLETSLQDITAACILENFQIETSLLTADRILKALGRKHAKEAIKSRKPILPSSNFIKTYFSSFQEDPVTKNYTNTSVVNGDSSSGFKQAQTDLSESKYENIVQLCTDEINGEDSQHKHEATLLRGTMKLLMGDQLGALEDFLTLTENESVDVKIRVNALIKRASMYMQLEQPHKSMEDFEKAAQLDPENPDVYHHRGQVRLLLEDLNKAIEDFDKAVNLNPEFPVAYVQKCYTDFRHAYTTRDMGKVQRVLRRFEKAVEKFPTCTEALTLYSQVLQEQENYTRADELYEKAIAADPQNATVYVHRAILQLHWKQDIPKAVEIITKALEMDDKCEFAYETLGTIEVQRANLNRAIELFDKAIPLAKTELEMAHLYSLKDAAVAQDVVAKKLGIILPTES